MRPSFQGGIEDWLTDADRERFDIAREETRAEIEKAMKTKRAA